MALVNDWFTEKALLGLASPAIFVRGAEAAEHGSVRILEQSDLLLRAQVDDTEVYETEFRVENGRLIWSCTCGEAGEQLCRHLAGAALATWPDEVAADE